MDKKNKGAVLFDCWSTLITFEAKRDDWNTLTLERHCVNRSAVDFKEVHLFAQDFFRRYYFSMSPYEIQIGQLLSLVVLLFDIKLDCPLEVCTHEILTNLSPKPVEKVSSFLKALEEKEIPYAILSNTVYDDAETFAIVKRLLPGHAFRFFLGSATVGVKKPNKLFFDAGLHLLEKRSEETVYVGDSFLADVNGSFHAGFARSYWLNLDRKNPLAFRSFLDDFSSIRYSEIKSYDEMIDLLEKGELF